MDKVAVEFIEQSVVRIEKNTPKSTKCLDQLSNEQVWMQPNEASNSIGNIMLHLCGNIRQYAISALGNQPDIRERDKEFSATGGHTKEGLLKRLVDTLQEAIEIIRKTDEIGLL